MSQIMKTFLGVWLILAMCLTEIGILKCFLQVMQAQNLQSSIISELEDSDFAPVVLQDCFAQARQADCDLVLTLYGETGEIVEAAAEADLSGAPAKICAAKVQLDFWIRFPGTGEGHRQSISAFAR